MPPLLKQAQPGHEADNEAGTDIADSEQSAGDIAADQSGNDVIQCAGNGTDPGAMMAATTTVPMESR